MRFLNVASQSCNSDLITSPLVCDAMIMELKIGITVSTHSMTKWNSCKSQNIWTVAVSQLIALLAIPGIDT